MRKINKKRLADMKETNVGIQMVLRIAILVMTATFALRADDFNAVVLAQVAAMPQGGGYATTTPAHDALIQAVHMDSDGVKIQAPKAIPSFCSGATYLVFLKTLGALQKAGTVQISREQWEALLPGRMADGEGVWGRWNANGPGTPRLFHELGIGRNFSSFVEARPGDFMKIFWSQAVGKSERGHSVIFLGTEMKDGVEFVRFWSSNKPGGYGEKSVPKSKVARAIFSRLEVPANLQRLSELPASDAYLAGLLRKESSAAEVKQMTGLR